LSSSLPPQTTSTLTSYLDTSVFGDSASVTQLINGIELFSNFGSSLQALQCAASFGFVVKISLVAVAPVAVFFFFLPLLYWSIWLCSKSKTISAETTEAQRADAESKEKISPAFQSALFYTDFIFFFIIAQCIGVLATFQLCATTDEGFFLREDPRVSCGQSDYKTTANVARIAAYFYFVVIVVLIIALYSFKSVQVCALPRKLFHVSNRKTLSDRC
jgi:hypothetical protein